MEAKCPKVALFSSTGLITLWMIMLSPSRSLNLSAPTDYLVGCATFDLAQGTMTPCPSPSRLREVKKALPISYLRVQRYAERNADKLKAIAKLERERGLNTHTLE